MNLSLYLYLNLFIYLFVYLAVPELAISSFSSVVPGQETLSLTLTLKYKNCNTQFYNSKTQQHNTNNKITT